MRNSFNDDNTKPQQFGHPIRTLNIIQASQLLGAHKETIRRKAAAGEIPGVKIGRGWRLVKHDLVMHIRSRYAAGVTSQGAVKKRETQWRFTKETPFGGLASPIMDKEYREALGLPIK